jgi:cystathionine gamma-synthase/methionine-gamma-lyase
MSISREFLDTLAPVSRTVHAGRSPDLGHATPTASPIHVATAYTYPTTSELDEVFADNSRGYVYSRMGNPTVRQLEQAIAAIEGMPRGVAYASGMAALHGVITTIARGGSRILASRDLYGATYAMLRTHLASFGVETTFIDVTALDDVERIARELKPALVLAETVSNPLIRVTDVRRLADISHAVGAFFALDNTFATPVLTRGADLGADLIVYSATKHLGGHGDTTTGLVATSDELAPQLEEQRKLTGGSASPFDAWLVLRGLRTLGLRVGQQCDNARALAAWLGNHPRIERVHFPGLDVPVPAGQFPDGMFGTMLAFEIRGAGREQVFRFQDALRMIQPATTLGDVYTLVLHPASTSHRTLTAEERQAIGIGEGLVRISAGVEHIDDITADLAQALDRADS